MDGMPAYVESFILHVLTIAAESREEAWPVATTTRDARERERSVYDELSLNAKPQLPTLSKGLYLH